MTFSPGRAAARRLRTTAVAALLGAAAAPTAAQQITEYQVPYGAVEPRWIMTGPDGNLWISAWSGNSISRLTPQGQFTVYPLPDPCIDGALQGCFPTRCVVGPDGALWFDMWNNSALGRITLSGGLSEIPLDGMGGGTSIALGGDGAFWSTINIARDIRRWLNGTITHYPVGQTPVAITSAPDGSLWFVELVENRVARITVNGVVTGFAIPTPDSRPWGITSTSDGTIWFVENRGNKIGRLSRMGEFREYPLAQWAGLVSISSDPLGRLWFAEYGPSKVGMLDPRTGAITEWDMPSGSSPASPSDVTWGPDGRVWIVESGRNAIAVMDAPAAPAQEAIPMLPWPSLAAMALVLAILGSKLASATRG